MTGGGFGGCVIALVSSDAVEPVSRAVRDAFQRARFTPPVIFPATPSGGAARHPAT
jgi:galactokinase